MSDLPRSPCGKPNIVCRRRLFAIGHFCPAGLNGFGRGHHVGGAAIARPSAPPSALDLVVRVAFRWFGRILVRS